MSESPPIIPLEGLSLSNHPETAQDNDFVDYENYQEDLNNIEFEHFEQLQEDQLQDHEIQVTKSQLDVITSPIDPGTTLQVIAGPGSGKTTTLVYKIAYMIGTLKIQPSEILVLSMTNKAVETLKQQVDAILGTGVGDKVDITTFHGFSHRLVLENNESKGLGTDIQIIEESGWRTLVAMVDGKITKPILTRLLEKIKLKGIEDNDVKMLIKRYKIKVDSLKEVLDTLESSNVLVHSDILRGAKQLIKDGIVQLNYKTVIVDEFQDVYPELYQLIELVGKSPHLVTAGDPDQSIYSFLGSNLDVHKSLQKLKPINKLYLQETFRSTPEIIHASDTLLGKEVPSIALKEMGGIKPMARLFDDENEQFEWIASEIFRLINDSEGIIEPNDITILGRTNNELNKIQKTLNLHGIMDMKLTSNPPWLTNNLFHLVDYLRVLAAPEESKFPIMCTLNLLPGVGKVAIRNCVQGAIEEDVTLWEYLKKTNRDGTLNKKIMPYVQEIEKARFEIDFDNPESIFKTVIQLAHDLGLLKLISKSVTTKADKEQIINQLQEFYENLKISNNNKATDISLTQHFLKNYLHVLPISKNIKSVKLSTVHSAKGLEFPIVFLLGSPLADFFRAEDKKLTYVAMTRAQSLLYVNRLKTDPMSEHNFKAKFKEDVFSRTRPDIKGSFIKGYAKEFNRTIPTTTVRSIHTLTRLMKRL
ncbi:ATP-dependent DNA helicase pcrA [Wickerhamomyces ciferrii]|uniref:DNA 3'-5' helicase n=1 Tax=Wickerhamomyces ciferrii (strain ATCC 14091 / BCRC 22168 / CBS 111 / JCM 3599 / NBRC 0793 / NRRL Y-1031 F-60-10) TaxID=1206466 RepID=K0KCC6_WICCF|nr:ATP-dependent DNA helicase pcrA [Wickerhamomyces ciferrii]CCH42730.1 ATP-dependent DNA helicase pcrA [Wickerhamomyces ciferrii]